MATGTGNLPNQSMSFSPFAILTAEELNDMVENIESLADGSGIGDGAIDTTQLADEAVTSDKIDFTTLAFGNYSTSEVNTGFKWIDGSDIYKKTVDIGTLPNNTTKNVAHGISNLSLILNYETVAYGSAYLPIPYVTMTSQSTFQIQFSFSSTNISVVTGNDRTGYSAYVTMYYTKSS